VTSLTQFGAFADWGLPKELLIPFAEQTCEMAQGQSYAIGVKTDREGRFVGTQRVAEMLLGVPPYQVDDWVEGEAWRRQKGLGVFVIVEKQYLGLLPDNEPHELKRGLTAKFRVSQVLPDGKIQLSLRRRAYEELEGDAERVLAQLKASAPRVGDHTEAEVIYSQFGLSKKAFKRALGRLFKEGVIRFDDEGCAVLVTK
jgi:predicted RNA-binding protein (virulence factor B family)